MSLLKKGQRFRDFDEFTEAVYAYGLATNAIFTTQDSKRNGPHQYVKLACKHYGNPRIRGKGIRPVQKTFKLNCPAFVYAKQAEGCVCITRMVLKHENHDCEPQMALLNAERLLYERQQLDKYEKKEVVGNEFTNDIVSAMLQNEVKKLKDKCLKAEDFTDVQYKLQEEAWGSLSKIDEAIAVLVDLLEKDPDAVVLIGTRSPEEDTEKLINLRTLIADSSGTEMSTQSEKELAFIFIQLGSMRQTFAKYPEVVIMDNTHSITETCMRLNLCMVMDSYGRSRVISYTFLGNEVQSTTASVLMCLKQANPDPVKGTTTVIIDKDMSERTAVREVLGNDVIVELCSFYVQHTLEEQTKDIPDTEVREVTHKILRSIVYAKSKEGYVSLIEMLLNVAPKEHSQYFLSKWHPIKEAWVYYKKLYVPKLRNDTPNRVFKSRHLKEVLETKCPLAESICGILLCHENKEQSVVVYVYEPTVKQSSLTEHLDPDVASILSACTQFAAKLMIAQINSLEGPHEYTSNGNTCECIFYKSLHLPCRHIFLERKIKGEPKFRVEDIPERWCKFSHGIASQVVGSPDIVEALKISAQMTLTKKYSQAYDVAKDICLILCRRETAQFNSGMQSFRNLRDLLMNGNDIAMTEVTREPTEAESDVSKMVPTQSAEPTAPSTVSTAHPGSSSPSAFG